MAPAKHLLPARYAAEYEAERATLIKSRVRLASIVTTFLFFLVSLQYVARKLLFGMNTFEAREVPFWVFLVVGTAGVLYLNEKARSAAESKRWGLGYNLVFSITLMGVGITYYENAIVFVFYYSFALILSALMIPWSLRDLFPLTGIYLSAFVFYYAFVRFAMGYVPPVFTRFHPLVDGLVFMGISHLICTVIRKKEIDRDIENFTLLKEVEEKNRQIDAELELANRVHKTLVPESIKTDQADIAVTYVPMGKIGGDYAKFKFLDENRLMVFISDVTGHGVPAALLVNRLHAEFERLSGSGLGPGMLLRELNRFILREFDGTNMYSSAFCGLFDFAAKRFTYSNYGHPDQYLFQMSRSAVRNLSSHTTLLGLWAEESGDHEETVPFEQGDGVLLFTDGVIETMGEKGEIYGEERLIRFLKANDGVRAEELNELLFEELDRFRVGPFQDDIFILNVKTKAETREAVAAKRASSPEARVS